MPNTMPKNPNWRKKKLDPVVAPRILPRHSDEELKKLEMRRAARSEVRKRQAARNQLVREVVEEIAESAGRRLPRRKMLGQVRIVLPHVPAHILSAVTAPGVPSGRA